MLHIHNPALAQAAYEADCAALPTNPDGSQRTPWARLDNVAQWSWARDPQPRDWKRSPFYVYMLDGIDSAALGYPVDASPYNVPEPRPLGFAEKGRAWVAGWTWAHFAKAHGYPTHLEPGRAHILA